MTEEQKDRRTHEGREVIYASLSRLFLESPSDKTYEMFNALIPCLEYMKEEGGLISDGIEGLSAFIKIRNGKKNDDLRDYDLDTLRGYTRLFCLTDSVPVSESYYTSVDKLVMQEARDEVMLLYKKSGFSMDNTSNEPEDHIAYELMYMSYLSMIAKKEAEQNNLDRFAIILEMQESFLTNHLCRWLDDFASRIAKFEEAGRLYTPAINLTIGFIKNDLEFLKNK